MTTFLTRSPDSEPVTLAEAKAHLRLDAADEDDLVGGLIKAARVHVEARTRRALIDQGWRTVLDAWPASGVVTLGPSPVASVEAVTVYDAAGAPTVVPESGYAVDTASAPARLRPLGIAAPGSPLNGIEIDFSAGYGTTAAAVPEPLRQAILMLVAHWFENREAASIGAIAAPVALGVDLLTAPYRVARL